ncbi:16S rRNA (uracil(1498)-N(3))-methyltransferase [Candidatus Saganbacteria bacterium]|nr:16S rRNA (uracil(1498)-N(3))-methyltransferase [Candidatus Saganbacteria bacterium]
MRLVHRFFVGSDQISNNIITISGSDVNHIKNVLRMKLGDQIEVFDSKENSYLAEITLFSPNNQRLNAAVIKKLNRPDTTSGQEPNITLAQCLPKAKKMDLIVQKATELGVNSIFPVTSERSVPKIEEKSDKKISHWQKIAKEASEQSGRSRIPKIEPLTSFSDLVKTGKNYDLALIPWEGEKTNRLKDIVTKKHSGKILVVIGPEGGFSKEEISIAQLEGLISISLGKRILRTETAGIVLLSQLFYEFDI